MADPRPVMISTTPSVMTLRSTLKLTVRCHPCQKPTLDGRRVRPDASAMMVPSLAAYMAIGVHIERLQTLISALQLAYGHSCTTPPLWSDQHWQEDRAHRSRCADLRGATSARTLALHLYPPVHQTCPPERGEDHGGYRREKQQVERADGRPRHHGEWRFPASTERGSVSVMLYDEIASAHRTRDLGDPPGAIRSL